MENKQKFVSRKIKKLKKEGMKKDQAVAVALEMARKKGFRAPKKG